MDLPVELRSSIIEFALLAERIPPTSPSKSNRTQPRRPRYNTRRAIIFEPWLESSDNHSPANSLSLLLTNRQILAETQEALARMNDTTYVLDTSVLNERETFPTWISIPRLTTHVSKVHVDVRLFGNMAKYNKRQKAGCGASFGSFSAFQTLLESFLKYGPVNEQKEASNHQHGQSKDRGVTIDTLIFDFESAETRLPFPPNSFELIDWHGGCPDSRPPDDFYLKYKTRPEWMMNFLDGWMAHLLGMCFRL